MKAAAARRVAEAKAQALAAEVIEGSPAGRWDAMSPTDIILANIRESSILASFYRGQVEALSPDQRIRGVRGVSKTESVTEGFQEGSTTSTTTDAGPDLHLWQKLWDAERDRLVKWCVDATRLGIEAKRVEQEQALGRQVAAAQRMTFDAVMRIVRPLVPAGSSVGDEIRDAFVESLRWLTSGPAAIRS